MPDNNFLHPTPKYLQEIMFSISLPRDRTELNDPTRHFRHDSLSDPGLIRLIELLPGGWEDDLRCNIHTISLETPPIYDALSYSWGDESQDDPDLPTDVLSSLLRAFESGPKFLRCNGRILLISSNLYNALRRLRDKSIKYLWVDRVCIDQSNILERTEQVRLMGKIYSKARLVVVWLGEEDSHTVPAFDLMDRISKLATESSAQSFHTNSSDIFDPDALQAMGLPSFPSAEWESMHRLFERRWFQRSWVIQEVALAEYAIVVCGCRVFNWDDVGRTGQYLVSSSFFRAMQDTYGRQGRPTFASSIQNSRARVILDADRSLTLLLSSMRRFQATDPRDKIYSLLGLSRDKKDPKPHCKANENVIRPDYSLSVETVFRQITKSLIKQESSLALLSTVEDASLSVTLNLPSWVPDYAVWQEVTVLGMPDNPLKYYACGDEPPNLYDSDTDINHDTLSLAGYEMDSVSEIGRCHDTKSIEPEVLMSWFQLFATLPESYYNGVPRDDVIWRTFIGNVGGMTHPAHADYARNFYAFLHHFLKDENDLRKALGILNAGKTTRAWQETGMAGDVYLYATSFVYIAALRRLFVTKKGYVGLSAKSIQTGDKVFVFPGGFVPFVLRASVEGYYRLVGEAYVHGIMRGEALKDPTCKLTRVNIR